MHRVGWPPLGLCLLFAVQMACGQSQEVTRLRTTCKSAADVREITLVSESRGCKVDYLKGGSSRTLWSSSQDPAYCADKARHLTDSLARGGYSCAQDASRTPAATPPPGTAALRREPPVDARKEALSWVRRRIKEEAPKYAGFSGKDAAHFPTQPDAFVQTDIDGDGHLDIIVSWGFAQYRCTEDFLAVLLGSGESGGSRYRAVEVELPSGCGNKGWKSTLKMVKDGRITVELSQRTAGAENRQTIGVSVDHAGNFKFYDPSGRPGSVKDVLDRLPKAEPRAP